MVPVSAFPDLLDLLEAIHAARSPWRCLIKIKLSRACQCHCFSTFLHSQGLLIPSRFVFSKPSRNARPSALAPLCLSLTIRVMDPFGSFSSFSWQQLRLLQTRTLTKPACDSSSWRGKAHSNEVAPTLCYKLGLSSKPVRDGSCREKRESAWHEHCSGANRERMKRRSCVWHRWRRKQTAGTKEERKKALTQKEDKPRRRRSEPAVLRTRWCFLRLHRHPSTATDAYKVLRTCAGGIDFTASLLLLPFEKTESLQQETFGTLHTTASLRTQGSFQHF